MVQKSAEDVVAKLIGACNELEDALVMSAAPSDAMGYPERSSE